MNKVDKTLRDKKLLSVNELIMIFEWLYKSKTGLPLSDERTAAYRKSLYESDLPVVVESNDYTFWLDKYYIAVKKGSTVNYLYATKDFALEEMDGLKNMLERNYPSGLIMLKEIKTLFKKMALEYHLEPTYQARLTKFKKYSQVG